MNLTTRPGKNISRLSLLGLIGLCTTATTQAQLINEIFWNPTGTDSPNEFVEIRGAVSGSLSNTFLVFVEGDSGGGPGDIQNIFNLSSFSLGSNGFLTIRQFNSPYSVSGSSTNLIGTTSGFNALTGYSADAGVGDIENLSFSALLINIGSGVAPTLTQDLDAGDNGLDALPTGWAILDSIAFLDGGASDRGYGNLVFSADANGLSDSGATFVNQAFSEAEYAMRLGNSIGSSASAWVVADVIVGTAPTWSVDGVDVTNHAFDNFPNLAGSHLGLINPIPEPSAVTSLLAGLVGLAGWRRFRRVAV